MSPVDRSPDPAQAEPSRMSRSWGAQMIAPSCDPGEGKQASFVSRVFDLAAVDPNSVLHVSAQGLYQVFINGTRVGTDLLTPGWTCYDDRIAYQSYPVADLLNAGENRIEIWLGDGWYRSPIMWSRSGIPNCWGDRIAAIAELVVGDDVLLQTDADWKSGLLPITKTGIYYGEDYDARLEVLSDSARVEILDFDAEKTLVPHETAPVTAMAPLDPVESWTDADGRFVYDFAQNCGAVIRISVSGEAGAKILIEHSEVLGPDRDFDNSNYRDARGAATYILKGDGVETWQPAFTFMGYRYAQITITGNAKVEKIVSIPVTSVPEVSGGFTSGVPAVDRLVLNTIWSQRSNFIEVPTDCPQRDERLGWTGDAQVFAGTACWLADCESFLKKYMRDVMHDQRPNGAVPHFTPDPTRRDKEKFPDDWAGSTGWGDAITVIPWQLYLHYGDTGVLRECFPAMLKWLDYLWNISDGPVCRASSVWVAEGFTFGDWLQPVGDNRMPRPTVATDCAATIYFAISAQLAAKIATVLGEDAEAERLNALFEQIKAAFEREYIPESGRLAHNDQTSYALCFLYDLIPDRHIEAAKGYFRTIIEEANYLIGTGFIGTPALLPALTKMGMTDLAEKVFLNREVPGWLYQVEQGATTIWERWDAMGPNGELYDPYMNSFNHYAYGAVCQWLFEDVAGLTPSPDGAGFNKLTLSPVILPELGHVEAWHDCRNGKITAGWTLDGSAVTYTVTLPAGCEATFTPSEHHTNCRLGDTPISNAGITLQAGTHEITFDLNT